MRSEPLAWQARLLTASALDQSPGAGDLVDERRGGGERVTVGGWERLLGRGIPEHKCLQNLTTGQGVEKGRQRMRRCWGRDPGGRNETIL